MSKEIKTPEKVLLISNKNAVMTYFDKQYFKTYVSDSTNQRFINGCRKNIGCKKISEVLYAPEFEIEVDNNFSECKVLSSYWTNSGGGLYVEIANHFIGKIVDHDMFDIIKHGHIENGIIMSPMKFIQKASQISLRPIRGE